MVSHLVFVPFYWTLLSLYCDHCSISAMGCACVLHSLVGGSAAFSLVVVDLVNNVAL